MTDSRETERFNFWCKGCGGVVYGFRSEHQHTELRPTVGRTRKAKARKAANRRHLTCCCCGESAGYWEQWFNRDTGYGVCAKCVAWVRSRGESEEEIHSNYGVEGVNWGESNA